jgi:hypothetical protein
MVPFPPGTGGGDGVAHGRTGKGSLIHSLTDAGGVPLAVRTTPANGSERAQVMPLLDAVTIKTGTRGRPRKRPKVLTADKGYDSKVLRRQLRRRGIRARLPKRGWKGRKPRGRPLKMEAPRFQAERPFAWFQKKYRRVVIRWERRSVYVKAFLAMAIIRLWIQKLIVG